MTCFCTFPAPLNIHTHRKHKRKHRGKCFTMHPVFYLEIFDGLKFLYSFLSFLLTGLPESTTHFPSLASYCLSGSLGFILTESGFSTPAHLPPSLHICPPLSQISGRNAGPPSWVIDEPRPVPGPPCEGRTLENELMRSLKDGQENRSCCGYLFEQD